MDILGVEVYVTGTRHGGHVTTEDLDDIVRAYAALAVAVPIKIQHEPVADLRHGRVENLRRAGEVLLGDLRDVPDELVDLDPYCSAETLVPARIGDRTFRRALTAVSLTDRPGCWGIADLRGVRRDEIVMRPTGEHGFESFVVEDEHALFVAETLIPDDADTVWEMEAEARGRGRLRLYLTGYDKELRMRNDNVEIAARDIDSEDWTTFSGRRIGGTSHAFAAPSFETDARASRLECHTITIRKINPQDGLVVDPHMTSSGGWLQAPISLNSHHFFDSPSAISFSENVAGEFNTYIFPRSYAAAAFFERGRFDRHKTMPGSGVASWIARIYCSSFMSAVFSLHLSIFPLVYAYTQVGTYADAFNASGIGLGGTAGWTVGSDFPADRWVDLNCVIPIGTSILGPPYNDGQKILMSLGFSITGVSAPPANSNPASFFVAYLNGYTL